MASMTLTLDRAAIARAARQHGVAELSVFGSAVSGDFSATSDVDFLVDFLPDRADLFEDFASLQEELTRITNRPVDLVVKRSIRNPYFRETALASAERIYVADI